MKIGVGIAILVFGCATIFYTLIGGAVTCVRAKRSGLLKLRLPGKVLMLCYVLLVLCNGMITVLSASAAHEARQVLEEAQTAGAEAFRRAEDDTLSVILDEAHYIEWKTAQYQKKADENQGKLYGYLGTTLIYVSLMLLVTGFVTKKGWYVMTEGKPRRLLPEERDGELLFFTERSAGTDKPLLRVKDTPENREKYAALLN